MPTLRSRAARVALLVLDVDGVLTDGRVIIAEDGVEQRHFHIRDGLGIKLLRDAGVEVAVISGRRSRVVEARMESLGVRHVYQGYEDKRTAFADLLARLDVSADRVGYVGDDLLDLPVMTRVGLAVAVADADPHVRRLAHYRTRAGGGRGAVREVCELILEAQGRLAEVRRSFER
ncbi:MAG: 3-deoxy-manno-octulosonate-8-phosphatase KdsC [Ectothiorhodospiraceae bacterium]|nr:3-deoxy-manno-octulosonate-8-phosphatase KdsC [Chromatiales bacterium]MCP5157584.1 3-deoxy-manno-octulosonate-8-phosphatase KdsC [Ectothiorhodospiraceae bacterium]